jgi:hypothetical protein
MMLFQKPHFSGEELQVERKWKERCSRKFRCRAVERMNACENIVRLSRDLGVCRTLLCLKFSVFLGGSPRRFSNPAVPKLYQNPM